MKKPEIIASILGLSLGLVTYWGTLHFRTFPIHLAGPEFFPRMLSILLVGLSLALLVLNLVKGKPLQNTTREGAERKESAKQFSQIASAMAASVGYFLIMGFVGFLLSTFLYFGFLMLLMQRKKKYLRTTAWSLSITIIAYILFGVLLKATLPVGTMFR